MTIIKECDIIESIASAIQYISYYHPVDYIQHLTHAYKIEKGIAAKDAIAQILINSRMCAKEKRPICQDTGIVNVFLKIGMNVRFKGLTGSISDAINEGVRRGYTNPNNILRASIVSDPHFIRKNTKDNTPAVINMELVPGNFLDIKIASKGGGSENKTKFAMLNPSDSLIDWIMKTVPTMGAGWCPPGILGIGIGGTPEKAMLMAKKVLMQDINMNSIIKNGPKNKIEKLRVELFNKINSLGIGAQGMGGLTTILDVKIMMYPTHAASKPIAIIPNCAATRHGHIVLNGCGPVFMKAPSLLNWPKIKWTTNNNKKFNYVNLNTLTKKEVSSWRSGEILLLNGKILTGRDAAHSRIQYMLSTGQKIPVNFNNRVIYYVGPINPVRNEVIGPAGPTTANRMDYYTNLILEKIGLIAMVGKAERSNEIIKLIKKQKIAYLVAVGGAAYLISKAIKSAKIICFEDLGMEAIYEFNVKNMPVTVAIDSLGKSIHIDGPKKWKKYISIENSNLT